MRDFIAGPAVCFLLNIVHYPCSCTVSAPVYPYLILHRSVRQLPTRPSHYPCPCPRPRAAPRHSAQGSRHADRNRRREPGALCPLPSQIVGSGSLWDLYSNSFADNSVMPLPRPFNVITFQFCARRNHPKARLRIGIRPRRSSTYPSCLDGERLGTARPTAVAPLSGPHCCPSIQYPESPPRISPNERT
jgi:hypothetical protein